MVRVYKNRLQPNFKTASWHSNTILVYRYQIGEYTKNKKQKRPEPFTTRVFCCKDMTLTLQLDIKQSILSTYFL
jgi:hypothetical protein